MMLNSSMCSVRDAQPNVVSRVFFLRSPAKIADVVVAFVSVKMSDLGVGKWWWP